MPTFERTRAFDRDLRRLTRQQQNRLYAALHAFIEDILAIEAGRTDRFRPGLRVKGVQGEPGMFEMTWAPNGRATFRGANPLVQGSGMWYGNVAAIIAFSLNRQPRV